MKKILLLGVVICLASMFSAHAFSWDFVNTMKEKIEAKAGEGYGKRSVYSSLISKNPDHLKPLINTAWEFTYTVNGTRHTDTLTFIGDVYVGEDGYPGILYMDQEFQMGGAMYTFHSSEAGGGWGFTAMTIGISPTPMYFFKTDGDEANGYWTDENSFTPYYSMKGKKIGEFDSVGISEQDEGYLVTSNLWIKAVIHTEEQGDIEAVFHKGDEKTTARGDKVIWGYFYADPNDVSWGDAGNPEVYVKIWFDASERIDVNFFHVSVPEIEVYSAYPYDGAYDKQDTITITERFVGHEFWK